MNIKDNKIYCHTCKTWLDKFTDILIINDDVICLFCSNKWIWSHLGFRWEAFPCEYYYLYHKKGQCRTCQEETNCKGNEDNCENEQGKECYEQELKEQND